MFLDKAEDYLLAAQNEQDGKLWTPAAGLAIHAGICAKDAIAVALTGTTNKTENHRQAVGELETILQGHPDKSRATRALGDLIAEKNDVEYTHKRIGESRVKALVRRAETLVEVARDLV